MFGQPNRERSNRQRRIGISPRGKDRSSSDIEVAHPVDETVLVDNAVFRVGMHASGTELVPVPEDRRRRPVWFQERDHCAKAGTADRVGKDLDRPPD